MEGIQMMDFIASLPIQARPEEEIRNYTKTIKIKGKAYKVPDTIYLMAFVESYPYFDIPYEQKYELKCVYCEYYCNALFDNDEEEEDYNVRHLFKTQTIFDSVYTRTYQLIKQHREDLTLRAFTYIPMYLNAILYPQLQKEGYTIPEGLGELIHESVGVSHDYVVLNTTYLTIEEYLDAEYREKFIFGDIYFGDDCGEYVLLLADLHTQLDRVGWDMPDSLVEDTVMEYDIFLKSELNDYVYGETLNGTRFLFKKESLKTNERGDIPLSSLATFKLPEAYYNEDSLSEDYYFICMYALEYQYEERAIACESAIESGFNKQLITKLRHTIDTNYLNLKSALLKARRRYKKESLHLCY